MLSRPPACLEVIRDYHTPRTGQAVFVTGRRALRRQCSGCDGLAGPFSVLFAAKITEGVEADGQLLHTTNLVRYLLKRPR